MALLSLGCVASAEELKTIRIGWQPTTTVQAQIAHTLAKTDILEKNGLKAEMTMFSFGPAVNEALVSGAIDVGFIGDMPSVSLAAAGGPTTVIARQSTFRGSIIASTKSDIKSVADLKGKSLYGPTGSAIYLAALAMLDGAKLKPGTDVQVVNMGFADLADALKSGKIDALFVWDPWVENFVNQGLARVVASSVELTMVVAMRDDYRGKNPDAVEKFLKAQKEATLFAASNHDKANAWFREPAAAQALSIDIVEKTTGFDPQWSAKSLSDIRLAFSTAEKERYLGLGKQAAELKIYPAVPPLEKKTDMSVAERLDKTPWSFDPKAVKVK
ncbi:NrtA/SsuA/CpmA family ABC transporter substrate-binding protein [Bradyrhizobium lablabi]|uniref:ABC transporter substrate-binding protein n=1 Tax=Bradyrhizobium lablabi TaxID=722472 RepID=UPI001BAC582B|nr:NrtA/SsuA/CpmA family ABC transporter substrate-binding protein [Bradyrhizobium lablabi]MBR1125457.1 NrtA/SsuA/CpmA family ABC transporter substrate-binding protein [Bradyrhizobium lablabi]